jgi:hypothetical protein
MDERRPPARDPEEPSAAVPALVEAQLEAARAEVFRAWVQARDKARDLGDERPADQADRQRRPS